MRTSATFALLSILPSTFLASASPILEHNIAQNIAEGIGIGRRQAVPGPSDLKTITTSNNITIRYKEPGKQGICETNPDVNSYSGYIDLSEKEHIFFWFFESRTDPANDPLTLWLNGGPGSDALLGLFDELGPCRITPELETNINPWSWNNGSNLLFISQPVGVGFSYADVQEGSKHPLTNTFLNATEAQPDGQYVVLDPPKSGSISTSDEAAEQSWRTIQALAQGVSQFGGKVQEVKTFNLWAESYGGHWGPAIMKHTYDKNALIRNGSVEGVELQLGTLGLVNPWVDAFTQERSFTEFAINNQYGIKVYNDSVHDYASFALDMSLGCLSYIQGCHLAAAGIAGGLVNNSTITAAAVADPNVNAMCSKAQSMCRDNVETLMLYEAGDNPRGFYDIRHPNPDPTPPMLTPAYLDQEHVKDAIGAVKVNFTSTSSLEIFNKFNTVGDWVFGNSKAYIEELLDAGVRVSLVFGDADYGCNWFGGQDLSLALQWNGAEDFAKAGYEAVTYDGVQYGEVREHGNLGFVRVYEAGHLVPYYQPQASWAIFNRTAHGLTTADGSLPISDNFSSVGPMTSDLKQTAEPFPPVGSEEYTAWAAAQVEKYDAAYKTWPREQ